MAIIVAGSNASDQVVNRHDHCIRMVLVRWSIQILNLNNTKTKQIYPLLTQWRQQSKPRGKESNKTFIN
jgi:hypothetical protein